MITTILYIVGSLLIVASVFLTHNMAPTLLMAGFLVWVYMIVRALWISLD